MLRQIIITLAQVLQTAFLVMIIIEIGKFIFGGSSGVKDAAQSTKDGAVGAGKKLFQGIKNIREKSKAKALQKEKELEDEIKAREEFGRFLGTISVDQRRKLETLKQGIKNLKILMEPENKSKLLNKQTLDKVKNGIIEPMNEELQKIRDEIAKLLIMARRSKLNSSTKTIIDELEKDYKEIYESSNQLLQKLLQQKTLYDKDTTGQYTETDKQFLLDNINITKQFIEGSEPDYKGMLETCENLKKDPHQEKITKLLDMLRQGRIKSTLDQLKNSIEKLNKTVMDLTDALDHYPTKRGEALSRMEKAIREFDENLETFISGESDFISNVGTLSQDVSFTDDQMANIKARREAINTKFEEFKNNDSMKHYFKKLD